MCTHCGCSSKEAKLTTPAKSEPVSILSSGHDAVTLKLHHAILDGNNTLAEQNRQYFKARHIQCVNLMGTPGAGKTQFLEALIKLNAFGHSPLLVIEGDQQSVNDATRVNQAGGLSVQINTGTGCHLDAEMVQSGLNALPLKDNGVVFIENVGNLVCPALFDLGESLRVTMMAVTDGEDKPEKYPHMFSQSDLVLINKSDLLPYVDVDLNKITRSLKAMNPDVRVFCISALNGAGIEEVVEAITDAG